MIPLLEIGRSMRRSHARRMVLCALDDLGRAYIAQVAERSRVSSERVHAVLHGKLPGFRPELALLALELVAEGAPTSEGVPYEITARGRLVVKSLRRGGLRLLVEGPPKPEIAAQESTARAAAGAAPCCPACGRPLGA